MQRKIFAAWIILIFILCGCAPSKGAGGDFSSRSAFYGSTKGEIISSSEVSSSSEPASTSYISVSSGSSSSEREVLPPQSENNITSSAVCSVQKKPEAPNATVKKLLSYAVDAAGKCLYVWGGGWNEQDTAAGVEALTDRFSPRWLSFFEANGADYDYNKTRYRIHDGLDCTGFIGYSVFRTFQNAYSNTGYVFESGRLAESYLSLFGGSVSPPNGDYQAGDILCRDGHAFIAIGSCGDGSLLFIHSSPPVVSLCGSDRPDGKESEASALAKEYMTKYRPASAERYDSFRRGTSFLTDYKRYRFDEKVLPDPDGYKKKNPKEILKDLFSEE